MKKILLLFVLFTSSLFAFEHITSKNFDTMVSNKKVVLDFYATWCPPCKIVAKHLESYNEIKRKDIYIYKVNIEKDKALLGRFDITSIPTLVYLNDGKPMFKEVGVHDSSEIEANVEKYLH